MQGRGVGEACSIFTDAKAAKQCATSELLDAMGTAKYAVHQGERIAMRAVRGDNNPHLRPIIPRKKAAA